MLLDASRPEAIEQAARRLADGGLVGLPTETVYGLAADADNASAVRRIFEAKGRPADHPLIVHVAADAPRAAVDHYAREVPAFAERLIAALWPGPLTLILPRRAEVAAVAAGGQDSVGLRCPSHPVAQAVLRAAATHGVHGVAAPSANRFGRVSPTSAAHVMEEFAALADDALLVLDGGACPVGIESTIVDCTRGHPVLLRPGVLTPARLEAIAGQPLRARDGAAPRASGTLESHYAPRAKVRLMDARQLRAAFQVLGEDARHIALYARSPIETARGTPRRRMPEDAEDAARELFAVLRELDATGVRLIWVETPPDGPEWDGVRDRLSRAAA
ncbi:MAG: threonylcarbamoyl-AMP synthase [Comamonadaceae bacterium]|uniref:Threonylcarbamoyl-AMP synthase n=1 Tax=Hydrogenophaga borbori TaxID=2294117 RepID=A0A372EI69_9BURK|nr:L-threonylcarbamoyladenylate synthase [Hydrogenophaga borbori]NCT97665.1 threonylcarbamoyl-AMP synthase [Comamonadaceae bacterium]RFP78040.1 threonylcarbamoyl-AMP synthase [Hydrogenophaga borbori]